MEIMIFSDMQTLDGYGNLIQDVGMILKEKEVLNNDFTDHIVYRRVYRN